MKKLILSTLAFAALAGPAIAADMPVKMYTKAPAGVAPPVNWTGCYIGANAGYGWGRDKVLSGATDVGDPNFQGGLGGAQIGCDYQFSQSWVIGIEAMYDFASLKGDAMDPINTSFTISSKYSALGNVAGRVGYAFDRSLVYFKGGLGYSRSERSEAGTIPAVITQTTGTITKVGWMIGGGWEYMLAANWSAKVEYNHYDFGNFSEVHDRAAGWLRVPAQ